MLKDDVKEIWSLLDNMVINNEKAGIEDGNIAIANTNVPLLSQVIEKTKKVIYDEDGLHITREIVEEFKHCEIDLGLYKDYSEMVIYVRYKDIGIEVTRVPKKELIS